MNDKNQKNTRFIYIMLGILTIINIVTLIRISGFEAGVQHILHDMRGLIEKHRNLAVGAFLNKHTQGSGNNGTSFTLSDYGRAILNDEIKQEIKIGLKTALHELKREGDAFVYEDAREQDTPEMARIREANFNQGNEIVENAIAMGKWEEKDNHNLIMVMPKLNKKQQHELRRKLARAINTGKIEVKDDPMF